MVTGVWGNFCSSAGSADYFATYIYDEKGAASLHPAPQSGEGGPRCVAARCGRAVEGAPAPRLAAAPHAPLHVRTTESAQVERCVEAGGHRPRRGWSGPYAPWVFGTVVEQGSVRPSALVLNR